MAFYETFFPWLLQYMRAEFYNSVEKRKDYCAFSALRLPLAKKRAATYSDEVLFDAVGLWIAIGLLVSKIILIVLFFWMLFWEGFNFEKKRDKKSLKILVLKKREECCVLLFHKYIYVWHFFNFVRYLQCFGDRGEATCRGHIPPKRLHKKRRSRAKHSYSRWLGFVSKHFFFLVLSKDTLEGLCVRELRTKVGSMRCLFP